MTLFLSLLPLLVLLLIQGLVRGLVHGQRRTNYRQLLDSTAPIALPPPPAIVYYPLPVVTIYPTSCGCRLCTGYQRQLSCHQDTEALRQRTLAPPLPPDYDPVPLTQEETWGPWNNWGDHRART